MQQSCTHLPCEELAEFTAVTQRLYGTALPLTAWHVCRGSHLACLPALGVVAAALLCVGGAAPSLTICGGHSGAILLGVAAVLRIVASAVAALTVAASAVAAPAVAWVGGWGGGHLAIAVGCHCLILGVCLACIWLTESGCLALTASLI